MKWVSVSIDNDSFQTFLRRGNRSKIFFSPSLNLFSTPLVLASLRLQCVSLSLSIHEPCATKPPSCPCFKYSWIFKWNNIAWYFIPMLEISVVYWEQRASRMRYAHCYKYASRGIHDFRKGSEYVSGIWCQCWYVRDW